MQPTSNEPLEENPSQKRRPSKTIDRGEWRDKFSFCIFGLTHKFGFVLILTAAHDIIHNQLPELKLVTPPRHSFELSSGVILLANVVPAHLLIFILPKLPYNFLVYLTTACLLNVASFVTIALSNKIFVAFVGVVIGSLGFGMADYALLTHSTLYNSSIDGLFTSASNFSRISSSLYYVVLRELKVSMAIIFYSVIPLQLFTIFVSWCLLRPPNQLNTVLNLSPEDSEFPLSIFNLHPPLKKFQDKCEYFGHLLKYIMPLGLIVIMQYFINQGLYEFVYFRKAFIGVDSQYRWLNFVYEVGFYACMTTKTLLVVNFIWIYTGLQFIVMCYFILDAIFFFTNYIWIVLFVAYLEGIISGAAYINTIEKMETRELESRMDLAEFIMKQSLSLKAILAGTLAIVAHYFLCRTAEPNAR